MSHHTEESGTVPDDRLLVRPYVTPPAHPAPFTTPAWPLGPSAVAVRAPAPAAGAPAAPASPLEGRRGSRRPLVVLALLALAAAGTLVVLLRSPEPEPARAVPPPELSVPVLPARSPGTDDTTDPHTPAGTAPSRSASGTPTPATTPVGSPTPTPTPPAPTPTPTPTTPPTPPAPAAKPSPATSGTLRPGDRGGDVRHLQERLHGQGFTYVSTTGVYDAQTERGVAQLQRDRSIKGDPYGVYGPATRAAFG
ncbi:peptidoglycan-binding protein [Streptomyces sp. NPDC001568]|uniref:peptidoglycan-binding domain-containing protein n=1 Tax=Streptomyces sp. NPDC001568 TaxID=3364588 RepID=UPI00369B2E7C